MRVAEPDVRAGAGHHRVAHLQPARVEDVALLAVRVGDQRDARRAVRVGTRDGGDLAGDHPHGGGEGKTSGGRHPVTPWGKPTKGTRPASANRTNAWILRRRNVKA